MRTSYGLSRYQSGEGDILASPQTLSTASIRGCMYVHGANQLASSTFADPVAQQIMKPIVDGLQVPMVMTDLGGAQTWGNSTAISRIGTTRTYQQSQQSVKTDKVLLLGVSMGTIASLNYAIANPTLVAAIVLLLPLPDLQAIYDNNRMSTATLISAAYGGRPADASNPTKNTGSLSGIPIAMWGASDDPYGPLSEVNAFQAATGATYTSLGAVGHSLSTLNPAQIATFLSTRL